MTQHVNMTTISFDARVTFNNVDIWAYENNIYESKDIMTKRLSSLWFREQYSICRNAKIIDSISGLMLSNPPLAYS